MPSGCAEGTALQTPIPMAFATMSIHASATMMPAVYAMGLATSTTVAAQGIPPGIVIAMETKPMRWVNAVEPVRKTQTTTISATMWTPASEALMLWERAMAAVQQTKTEMTFATTSTPASANMMRWGCAMEIAHPMWMATVCATMQKSPVALTEKPATTTRTPPMMMAAAPPWMQQEIVAALAPKTKTGMAFATIATPVSETMMLAESATVPERFMNAVVPKSLQATVIATET